MSLLRANTGVMADETGSHLSAHRTSSQHPIGSERKGENTDTAYVDHIAIVSVSFSLAHVRTCVGDDESSLLFQSAPDGRGLLVIDGASVLAAVFTCRTDGEPFVVIVRVAYNVIGHA